VSAGKTSQQQENMKVLITNDDGYFAEGLQTLARYIAKTNDVFIVAPQFEQSGISQAITFLRPLTANPVVDVDDRIEGYTVNGTPADCVKLGIHELCPWKPDLVISGINCGLNVGINVCHSGTVGGAFAAAMFDLPAAAVSVEANDPNFDLAAEIGWSLIQRTDWTKLPARSVMNINVPSSVTSNDYNLEVVPVETNPLGYHFQKGNDPKNRPFYWATNSPAPKPSADRADTVATRDGSVTVSTICYDPNGHEARAALAKQLGPGAIGNGDEA
jgi:5'-nucleotidase